MSAILRSPGVTEQVTDYLQSQISEGRWAPGMKIDSENKLTQELGVSRASVRAGIRQLIAIGVLESFQGKGTFVRAIPAENITKRLGKLYEENKDMHDLMEYRMILEVESCRLAAKRISPEGLLEMRRRFDVMRAEYQKGPERDSGVFADSDFGFHRQIYYATGNQLVIGAMKRIGDVTEQFQRQFNTDYLCEQALHYHERIFQAVKERDGERAAREMRKHLQVCIREYDLLLQEAQERRISARA